jgi:hypothetical protein
VDAQLGRLIAARGTRRRRRSLADVIAAAKQKPETITYGTPTTHHRAALPGALDR